MMMFEFEVSFLARGICILFGCLVETGYLKVFCDFLLTETAKK